MIHHSRLSAASPPITMSRLVPRVAAALMVLAPLAVAGCSRKPLPPTVGAPEDIMKNVDGTVGPMPGTPGYKAPAPAK